MNNFKKIHSSLLSIKNNIIGKFNDMLGDEFNKCKRDSDNLVDKTSSASNLDGSQEKDELDMNNEEMSILLASACNGDAESQKKLGDTF